MPLWIVGIVVVGELSCSVLAVVTWERGGVGVRSDELDRSTKVVCGGCCSSVGSVVVWIGGCSMSLMASRTLMMG